MTPITKQQVEELIDRLADKSLSIGQRIIKKMGYKDTVELVIYAELPNNTKFKWIGAGEGLMHEQVCKSSIVKILGRDILVGDVLRKLEEHFAWGYRETSKKALASTAKYEDKTVAKLWRLWKACGGADKSLQQIAQEDTKESQELCDFIFTLFPND